MKSCASGHVNTDAICSFDARGVTKRFRHMAIFGAMDALQADETMRFCIDHDPIPMLHQLSTRIGETVTVQYVKRETGAIVIDFICI